MVLRQKVIPGRESAKVVPRVPASWVCAKAGPRRHRRPPARPSLSPAIFDRDILPLGVTGLAKSIVERGQTRGRRAERLGAEKANHRHRLLLRTGEKG